MSSEENPRGGNDPVATGEATTTPGAPEPTTDRGRAAQAQAKGRKGRGGNMLPGRERRRLGVERLLVRLIATAGIIGIGVALGAILISSNVQGWVTGLVVAAVSVVLSAILWSSRQL
jgi:hypothetical protein